MRPPILTRRTIFGLISGSGLLVAAVVFSATTPQSAHEATQQAENPARVASPYVTIKDEPPPTLFVDPPFPEPLARGIVQIQWRVENVRILPVFGKDALDVSPRVGHLHIHVDDLPWLWAHTSDINTIDLAGMPPGQHRVLIELVDTNHHVFPGQAKTVTFTVPDGPPQAH